MLRRLFQVVSLVGASVLALACGSGDDTPPSPLSPQSHLGGQTGGEAGLSCASNVSVSSLGFSESSALGFSAADVARVLPTTQSAPFAWSDGAKTSVTLSLALGTTAGYAPSCHSNAVNLGLALDTADGALAESIPVRLFSSAANRGYFNATLALDMLAGDLASSHPGLVMGSAQLFLRVDFANGALSGGIRPGTAGGPEIGSF